MKSVKLKVTGIGNHANTSFPVNTLGFFEI